MWRRLFPHQHFHLPLVLLPHAISLQTRTFNANCIVFGFESTSCTTLASCIAFASIRTHRTPNRIPSNNNNKDLKRNERKKNRNFRRMRIRFAGVAECNNITPTAHSLFLPFWSSVCISERRFVYSCCERHATQTHRCTHTYTQTPHSIVVI